MPYTQFFLCRKVFIMKKIFIGFLFLVTGAWHVFLCASEKKQDRRQTVAAPHSILKVKNGGVEKPRRTDSHVSLVLENNTEHGVLKHCQPAKEAEQVERLVAANAALKEKKGKIATLQKAALVAGVDKLSPAEIFGAERQTRTVEQQAIITAQVKLVEELRPLAAQVHAFGGNLVTRSNALRFKDRVVAHRVLHGAGKRIERRDAVKATSVEHFFDVKLSDQA